MTNPETTTRRMLASRTTARRGEKRRVTVLLLILTAAGLKASSASGDVLWLRDGNALYGRIEAELPDHYLFRERTDRAGQYRSRTVRRDEVVSAVRTIDDQRLARLAPGDWSAYRDLAEELEVQQADPEARETALHLYLLLARHTSGQLQERGFRGALAVADPPGRQLIRALAHQQLAGSGTTWLGATDVSDPPPPVDLSQLGRLQAALLEYRTGAPRALQRLAADPKMRGLLEPFAATCSWPQFRELAEDPTPDYAALARAIDLELAVARWMTGVAPEPLAFDSPWRVLAGQPRDPVPLPDFDSVTPIPLSRTVWRDGRWKEPDE